MNIVSEIAEALQYGFIQRALLAGSFVAVSCAFLGVFLVLRRFSMIGDGLSHFAFAAIGLGLLLQVWPLYVAAPLTVLASLGILYMSERGGVYGDSAIGMVAAVGVAIGITLASLGDGFNVDLFSYLFGDITAISKTETYASVFFSLLVIALVALFYHDLFAIAFDDEYASTLGIKTGTVSRILIVLTSVTVVMGIKVVGTMLVSSLIIFPAATGLQIAKSFKTAIALALFSSVASVIIGILLAYVLDIPAGAAIVLLNFFFFSLVFVAKRWVRI